MIIPPKHDPLRSKKSFVQASLRGRRTAEDSIWKDDAVLAVLPEDNGAPDFELRKKRKLNYSLHFLTMLPR
jgi:hypothetical protein